MNPQGQPDPTTQYQALKDAIVGSQQTGSGSPIGSFPELDKMYGLTKGLDAKSAVVQGASYNAAVEDANAKRAAADAKSQQDDMLNPNKYRVIPKADGGYAFVAPNGQEVSASDYAHIAGTTEDKVLNGSQNPIDISFQQDYQNLQKFIGAFVSKDKTAVNDLVKADPSGELQKYVDNNDLPGLIQRFQQAYPTVYGKGGFNGANSAGQQTGSTYIPDTPTTTTGITP